MADSFTHAINLGVNLDIVKVTNAEALANIIEERVKKATEYITNIDAAIARLDTAVKTNADGTKESGSGSGQGGKDDNKMLSNALGSISKGTQAIATGGMNILKTGLGILTDVFERIKAASPLLQAVETLFNLAVQLFFMPLGTKLATVLLPAVINLVDGVMQIWDGFEGKSLSELLADMITLGAQIFGQFFLDIGSSLESEEGIMGAIGKSLTMLGNFIQKDGVWLLNTIIDTLTLIIKNIPTIIGIIAAFAVATKALQIAQIITIASLLPHSAAIGAAALGTALAAGGAAYAYTSARYSAAEGGYFPSTPGGVPVLIAEGGEGETVVPDSKKLDFANSVLGGGGNNYYYTFNGYTDNDILEIIRREISNQVSYSRLKGGF